MPFLCMFAFQGDVSSSAHGIILLHLEIKAYLHTHAISSIHWHLELLSKSVNMGVLHRRDQTCEI